MPFELVEKPVAVKVPLEFGDVGAFAEIASGFVEHADERVQQRIVGVRLVGLLVDVEQDRRGRNGQGPLQLSREHQIVLLLRF